MSISGFQLVELLLAMYEELGLLEELRIPREVLKKFLVRYLSSVRRAVMPSGVINSTTYLE